MGGARWHAEEGGAVVEVLNDAYLSMGRGAEAPAAAAKQERREAPAIYFLLAMLLESQSRPSYRPSPDVAQVDWMYLWAPFNPPVSGGAVGLPRSLRGHSPTLPLTLTRTRRGQRAGVA